MERRAAGLCCRPVAFGSWRRNADFQSCPVLVELAIVEHYLVAQAVVCFAPRATPARGCYDVVSVLQDTRTGA
jgi:hypothetical protein